MNGLTTIPRLMDIRRATKAQIALASRARIRALRRYPRVIGAADVAYSDSIAVAAYAELDLDTMEVGHLTTKVSSSPVGYISGYLAFREAGPVLGLVKNLPKLPDLLLANGHGLAHPRLCGLATHLGVVLNIPTIGIASRMLGPRTSTYNRLFCRKLGSVYVSPGNLISLKNSLDIVNRLPTRYGYPEPLGSAHNESKRALKAELR